MAFAAMSTIWGLTWIPIKVGVEAVSPSLFASTRGLAAGGILLLLSSRDARAFTWTTSETARLVVASFLAYTATYALLFRGLQTADSGLAAVVNMSLIHLSLLALSVTSGEERLTRTKVAAAVIGCIGLALLEAQALYEGSAAMWGLAAISLSAFAYGWGSIMCQPLLREHSALQVAGLVQLIGSVMLIPLALAESQNLVQDLQRHGQLDVLLSWAFLVAFGSVIAFSLYLWLTREWTPARAGLQAFTSPVLAVLAGALFLEESLSMLKWVGMGLMLDRNTRFAAALVAGRDDMRPELEFVARSASEYLDTNDERSVATRLSPSDLRDRLTHELTDEGVDVLDVLRDLVQGATDGLLHTTHPRFFGWVIGGSTRASLAADWLTSTWDQNAAAYSCSPSAAIIEEIAADWLKQILGLPHDASYAFVTGCQMAHFTALAAARHRVLANVGWSAEEQGLAGSPPIRVVVGEHHETLLRALRQLGIGTQAVVQVAQESDGTISVDALQSELAGRERMPTIVSLAAGDLNRGAFDPFGGVCDVAHEFDAWVHIDGAFGLWAGASPELKHLVSGVEKADSWATDAHKWLNVPYDSGIVFVKDADAHRHAMTIPAAYAVEVADVRDQYEWGPDWSRRARAIPIYAALRTLGRTGVANLIERSCAVARELVRRLGALDGVEVLAEPIINQGLVRFLAADGDHDRQTEWVIKRINETGVAWFGPTTWERDARDAHLREQSPDDSH